MNFLGTQPRTDAGAADAVLLGHADAGAAHRRRPSGAHAAGARSDHEQIVVVSQAVFFLKRCPGRRATP